MAHIGATISINDEPAADIFAAMLELEVEEDHRLAGMFRLKLSIERQDDGEWTLLEDERVALWNKVLISAVIEDEETALMEGYITQIKPHLDADENACYMEIYGLDGSCLMSLEEKIKDWPNKTDSDIAQEIFQTYSLTPEVDTTDVVHDEAVTTIIQRETDIQFLKRLARRNGFECFVKGDTGYFRKPVLNEAAQPVLALLFGSETNLVSFDARMNALRPVAVEMHQIDSIGKQIQDAVVASGAQRQLGRDGPPSLQVPNGISPRLLVKQSLATDQAEMENLCRAIYDEAEWFIEANGVLEPAIYGAILEAKSLVPVKGVSEPFSGIYYVTNVKHLIGPDSYRQQFTARRNALAPSGPGDFGGNGSLLGGLL